jgi:hypothetical protein
LDVDFGREHLVPFVDGQHNHARVDFADQREALVGEGGDSAEGVHEGGRRQVVSVYGVLLLFGGALAERAEGTADVPDCSGVLVVHGVQGLRGAFLGVPWLVGCG